MAARFPYYVLADSPEGSKLEMELAQMSPEDAAEFLKEYGITEPGLSRVIRLSYQLLGLQAFFTVGEDEVRRAEKHLDDATQVAFAQRFVASLFQFTSHILVGKAQMRI